MEFIIEKNIDCSKIKPSQCSDVIVEILKDEGLKLRADKNDDTVNGHIIIESHDNLKHIIHITIYDENEVPSSRHATTFKKPSKTFTLSQLKTLIK